MTEPTAEILEIFREEANERIDHMVDTLLALEAGRADDDAVDDLFRDAHTIKGAAGMLGLNEIQKVAHAVEDVLDAIRGAGAFPSDLGEPLLRAADSLRLHVEGRGGEAAEFLDELADRRTKLVRGVVTTEERTETAIAPGRREDGRSIRVPAEKLDSLLGLVGETVLHRRRLEHVLTDRDAPEGVSDELGVGGRLLDELQEAAVRMRTLPLASITSRFARAVRDLAAEEGKEVELVVRGAETELDRIILETLSDPLVHLLRNAIAHGIERPEEREQAGKPRRGRLELKAEQRGRIVAVAVADDGRGVPVRALEAARREGSLIDVLARPGFSTAHAVSELSGRGVGLDAVKAYVETFGGNLNITSEPGRGTEITLLLPLTLALLDVLLVEREGQVFGLPLASVDEAVLVTDTLSLAGRDAIELRGESLPLADLAALVGRPVRGGLEQAPAVVVSAAGRRVAAMCDRLLGEEEVVVKALGTLLSSLPGYLGAAVLGDGRIALLLDPAAVVRAPSARRQLAIGQTASVPPIERARPKVLVVEDSLAVRELQRSILEAAGYRVETARDGRDALDHLAQDDEIRLVLTDVEMPEMDGIELIEAIRRDPDRSSLPIVIVTTRGGDEDRRRGAEAGADAYLAKQSFDQQALLETVERLVGT